MRYLIGNILWTISTVLHGATTFLGTIVAFIAFIWLVDVTWWQGFWAAILFFVIWYCGGGFVAHLLACTSLLLRSDERLRSPP